MATLHSSFYTNRAHSVPNAQLWVFAQNVLHSFLAQYFWMWVTLANFTIDRKLNEQINIKIDFLLGLLSFVLSFDVNLKPISWNTVIKLLAPQDALEVILTHSLNVSTDLTDVTPTQLDIKVTSTQQFQFQLTHFRNIYWLIDWLTLVSDDTLRRLYWCDSSNWLCLLIHLRWWWW